MTLRVCTCRRLYSVIWRTECPGVRKSCESPVFSLEDSDFCFESKVELNDFWESEDLWQIYLKKLSLLEILKGFQVTTYMEDRDGKLERIDCVKLTFGEAASLCISSHFASHVLDRKHELMADNVFTLVFVFDRPTVARSRKDSWKGCIKTEGNSMAAATPSCMQSLSTDFGKLLDGSIHPDLEIRCCGQAVPAHRAILSSRSEVFAAMLDSGMLETQSGRVEIVDMDLPVLKEFLRYIYTGTLAVGMPFETAVRLYEAGDKYAVGALRELCGNFLAENVTQENALELLAVADAHCDHRLKDRAVCYIVDSDTPLTCEHWPRFSDEHPRLANEVLYLAYKMKCSPK